MRELSVFIFAFSALLAASRGYAYTSFTEGLFKKQQEKASARWTLADWLSQKKTFLAMDQWLALNRSKDLFEFNLEGGKSRYDLTVNGLKTEQEIDRLSGIFYWSIFGIQYIWEESDERWKKESGQLNLRLLGTSSQSTNLTGFYGASKWKFSAPAKELEQNYYGGRLTIYILSFFGIDGEYRKSLKAKDESGTSHENERIDYGAFIDVLFVRLYAAAFTEEVVNKDENGIRSESERDGFEAGVKLYF